MDVHYWLIRKIEESLRTEKYPLDWDWRPFPPCYSDILHAEQKFNPPEKVQLCPLGIKTHFFDERAEENMSVSRIKRRNNSEIKIVNY